VFSGSASPRAAYVCIFARAHALDGLRDLITRFGQKQGVFGSVPTGDDRQQTSNDAG